MSIFSRILRRETAGRFPTVDHICQGNSKLLIDLMNGCVDVSYSFDVIHTLSLSHTLTHITHSHTHTHTHTHTYTYLDTPISKMRLSPYPSAQLQQSRCCTAHGPNAARVPAPRALGQDHPCVSGILSNLEVSHTRTHTHTHTLSLSLSLSFTHFLSAHTHAYTNTFIKFIKCFSFIHISPPRPGILRLFQVRTGQHI